MKKLIEYLRKLFFIETYKNRRLQSLETVQMINEHTKIINHTFKQIIEIIDLVKDNIANNVDRINEINLSLDNRRTEIDGLIEFKQNLDNNEVIRDLHLRIEKLENDKCNKTDCK
jgi:hypothetical protein